ncbi:MAG: DUF262 domain-containing protein [Bacteroidetes bacterium]|nr:DUF262 domain-containing protein [Bacteroidota bacterium]
MEQGTIELTPDFQRKKVWDKKQKCRLIESLMLKIPIPMFYVAADETGKYSVVDGLQRLSTISEFILGEEYLREENRDPKKRGRGFKLGQLEFWGDKYDNFDFTQLPTNIQNRILETEFTFTIINPGTPQKVQRNVFKRINTGGEPLTAQEIRHALYGGSSTKLLKELSESKEFKDATGNSVNDRRMMDRELILRFLAFTTRSYLSYPRKGDMDSFLSDTMQIINIFPELNSKKALKILPTDEARNEVIISDVVKLRELFSLAMTRASEIFKEHSFRKSYGDNKRTPINKSLFEVWSVLLSKLTISEFNLLKLKKVSFLSEYSLMLEEESFINTISRDSLKYSSVKNRYEELIKLLSTFIHD